jgi:tRNA U55 pseudouridine synthase TruB
MLTTTWACKRGPQYANEGDDMDVNEAIDVNTTEVKSKAAKVRRRATTKADTSGKRSLNIRIDDDTYERLAVHAMRKKTTISALVMEFARTHLREFSIHRNATKDA